jgi:hypothetical protein
MPQIFGRKANDLSRLSLFLILLLVTSVLWTADQTQRSPYVTEVDFVVDQPVAFSHQHHVTGLGIDCRYCHTSAEKAAFAGIPPTSTCMTCHSQVWTDSPMLAPVRDSYQTGKPIPWRRIHDLPDFVYFNHSIHLSKGIGCSSCHGRVDEMDLTYKTETLYMGWCLDCHRHPGNFVREKKDVYRMDWEPRVDQTRFGAKLVEANHIVEGNVTCSACHR